MAWSDEVHASRVEASLSAARMERSYKVKGQRMPIQPTAQPLQAMVAIGAAVSLLLWRRHRTDLQNIKWKQLPVLKQFHELVYGSSGATLASGSGGSTGGKGKGKKAKKGKAAAPSPAAAAGAAAAARAAAAATPAPAPATPPSAVPPPAKPAATATTAAAVREALRPTVLVKSASTAGYAPSTAAADDADEPASSLSAGGARPGTSVTVTVSETAPQRKPVKPHDLAPSQYPRTSTWKAKVKTGTTNTKSQSQQLATATSEPSPRRTT